MRIVWCVIIMMIIITIIMCVITIITIGCATTGMAPQMH